ncbi:Organic hydroperoxide resistance protein OhrB [Enterococcus hirae]|uniref:organic hydroperoxide resistance protein n=1 Tax=Enterococcus hirae TaxID=1354 RepID=UPI00195A3039|nr:organic hydroperoxide resistance protein [Enterococcus hirae]VTX70343.1 Organic hydroperoxide resistance protein OhrB [Enterococcus hirae]
MKKIYETAMINRGGRDGEVEAPNGSMHMKIDRPGIHSEGTNPEQLFAAGYASCFNGAVQHMLEENNLESDSEVKARVSLFQLEDGGYQIGVVLEVSLPGLEKDQAEKIAEEAHAFCPYSKATRGNIDVEVTIVE